MNLRPEQYLAALALVQAGEVVPALQGSYAAGTAGTIAGVLMMAMQDVAGLAAREAAEAERLRAIFAAAGPELPRPAGGTLGDLRAAVMALHAALDARRDEKAKTLARRILDHYVETAEAALLVAPPKS